MNNNRTIPSKNNIKHPQSNVWVPRYHQCKPSQIKLFCFPFAGGSAFIYRNWSFGESENIAVCPVQLPGRETRFRESLIHSMSGLTEAMVRGMAPLFHGEFAFFGHSMGALVSYELTQHLDRLSMQMPVHLFVSGCPAPNHQTSPESVHKLGEKALIKQLREMGGTPEAVLANPELMALFLPIVRADFEIMETYLYRQSRPLDCPITVFGGQADPKTNSESLNAWQTFTTGTFDRRMFPGGHFYLDNEKDRLLSIIVDRLEKR